MATFHVVPRGDAVCHDTHGDRCACVVEVKMFEAEEPGRTDVWIYHRRITLEEAVMATLPEVA